jgi:hypothetical protein
MVLTDQIDDGTATCFELSHEPIYAGLRHSRAVEPIEMGMADEEQFLADETLDFRMVPKMTGD